MTAVSDRDVSRIDPEEALVDFETVDPGDISQDISESMLLNDYGHEDKVLVSIRWATITYYPMIHCVDATKSKTDGRCARVAIYQRQYQA